MSVSTQLSENIQLTNTIDNGEPELSSSDKINHSDESFSAESTSSEFSIEQGNFGTQPGGQHC